jgi:signal transduction histidine kinase
MPSTDQIFGPSERAGVSRDSWLQQDTVDFAWSDGAVLPGVMNSVESELTLLRSIATRLTSRGSPERVTPSVSILNDLIPGIQGCLILLFDPVTHQLRPDMVLNVSKDFIAALERNEQRTHVLATARRQIKLDIPLHIPGNKQFRFLWSTADREGIRTLWLVPWHDRDGSFLGICLFTSGQDFSPSRQALASVMLLIDWLSMVRREARAVEQYRRQPYAPSTGKDISPLSSVGDNTSGMGTNSSPPLPELVTRSEPDAISILSHELLSPLTLIKGYAATLRQLSEVVTKEQREHYYRGIESATNKVIRLLESLRDISQLEGGNGRLLAERTFLADLLREAASEVQNQTAKHVIKLRLPRTLPSLNIDRHKILQVMANLLGNAVKYSPQGGDIEVTAREVQSEEKLREAFRKAPPLKTPCIIVSISDHGVGIPEGDLARIFDKFYRVDNRLTRTIPGAGLGLYICKMIVTAHGGHIWGRSTPGSGSTFFFSLPLS